MRNVFERMDNLIEEAGTSDPFELLDHLGVKQLIPLYGGIPGYVFRCKGDLYVAYSEKGSEADKRFVLHHECDHVVDHYPADGSTHCRGESFAFFTMDKNISIEEKEANLCAAEYTIPTNDVLDLVGYNNGLVQEYIRLNHELSELSSGGEAPPQEIYGKYQELKDLGSEITANNLVHSNIQIARQLGFREAYVAYKIEALRLRGYDIPEMELPDFQHVFGHRRGT